VSGDEFVESVLAAPVGAALLATLDERVESDVRLSATPSAADGAAVDDDGLSGVSWGGLLSAAVEAGLFRVGPWMSESPENLADAYRQAGTRRRLARAVANRFGRGLHATLDVSTQQWWHSGSPDHEFFTRPRFRRFDDVYEAGQFTFAGMWTVSDPPAEVHGDLISAWELEPDPVTRWHLPIQRDVRVWEIHRPADWVRLVSTYPADGRVYSGWELPGLNQHRRDLRVLLAVDGQHGARTQVRRQLVPDWAAVAADYDGVHLSWAGFLTAEGYVADLEGGDVTMLRYWFSERTLWLRDAFGEPVPLSAPHSDHPDVVLGIDVRHDAARRANDTTVLRSQRGQQPPPP
jgi:hypothetical protein